jgi:DNA-binding transcriptional MerR regulator
MAVMTIGQLAKRTGMSVRTLRFYADEGVLPEVRRTESGYRLFGPEAVARGRFVRSRLTLRSARCACSERCCAPSPDPPTQRSYHACLS